MEINNCTRLYADKVQLKECKKTLSKNASSFTQLSAVLELAANEVRLKILFLLEEEDRLCPCDLSDILGISIPAVSQHLRKLKDGKVIASTREGQTIYYSLKKEHIQILKPFFKYINQENQKIQIV